MAGTDLYQLYRIASLYYREGKRQDEIGELENMSRSQISRLLDKARELGVVRIEVTLPLVPEPEALSSFLQQRLGLKQLILARTEEGWDKTRITQAVAETGAEWLPRLLRGAGVIGLGWGETVYRMAETLRRRSLNGTPLFIPLIGASGNTNPYLQINTIIDRVSDRLDGDRFFANLPAFREKNVPLTAYENKRLLMLHDYWEHTQAAVFGLGARESILGDFDEEVSPASRQRIIQSDVIGDILSQFFFADGSLLKPDGSFHINAFPAEQLISMPRTICLAGGSRKVAAIVAAARAGYFKTLITDTQTAALMYEQLRKEVEE